MKIPTSPRALTLPSLTLPSLCLPILLLLASEARAEEKGSLSVQIVGLRSNRGKVGCSLFDSAAGFPKDVSQAKQVRWCNIDRSQSSCTFDPIPKNTYAVACFHDENDNRKLDTNWIGIPKEGTVASNHARGSMGPPSFEDAKFVFDAKPTRLALRIGY